MSESSYIKDSLFSLKFISVSSC